MPIMKLNIKDFRQHKKLWLGLFLALLVALGGWYYFWIYAPVEQKNQSVSEFEQMISFEIKDDTIPQEVQDRYFKAFDKGRKFFSEHQNSIESFSVLLNMGLIKELVGDYKGAEQIFLYTYKLEPNSFILNGNLGHLYLYYLKDYPKAEEFYKKAVANGEYQNLYTYYTEMYDLYHSGFKDPAKTQALLTEALERIPDNLELLRIAGAYYKSIGNMTEARNYYQRALDIDSNDIVSRQALEQL